MLLGPAALALITNFWCCTTAQSVLVCFLYQVKLFILHRPGQGHQMWRVATFNLLKQFLRLTAACLMLQVMHSEQGSNGSS